MSWPKADFPTFAESIKDSPQDRGKFDHDCNRELSMKPVKILSGGRDLPVMLLGGASGRDRMLFMCGSRRSAHAPLPLFLVGGLVHSSDHFGAASTSDGHRPEAGVSRASAKRGGGCRFRLQKNDFRWAGTFSGGEDEWKAREFDLKVSARAVDANLPEALEAAELETNIITAFDILELEGSQ